MAKSKYKRPPRPAPLKAVLKELKSTLDKYRYNPDHATEKDIYIRGIHAGYEDGIKQAIEIVNYEIGIRQNPPNIFYGLESEEEKKQRLQKRAEDLGIQ
jgi:hypothetical protein